MVKDTIEPDKVTVVEANQQPNLNIINVEDTFTQVQPEEALVDGVDVEDAQGQVLQLVRTPYSLFCIMVNVEQQARLQLNQVLDQGEADIQNQGEEFFDAMDEAGQEIAIDEFDDYSLPTFDPGGVKDSIILTTLNNLQQVPTISRISTVSTNLYIGQLPELKEVNSSIYIPHFKSEEDLANILAKCVDRETFIHLTKRCLIVSTTGTRKFLMITRVIHQERGVLSKNHCCIIDVERNLMLYLRWDKSWVNTGTGRKLDPGLTGLSPECSGLEWFMENTSIWACTT